MSCHSNNPSIVFVRAAYYAIGFFAVCLLANACFLITSLLVMPLDGVIAYEINSQIARFLWSWMQSVFESRHRAVITFSGDVLPERENAIVIANHVSYSDFYMINGLAARKRMLPYCRWFIKRSLIWQLPMFGLSMYLIGMLMVARDWLRDSKSIASAFRRLKEPSGTGKKVWLVSFPEGTRLTPQKLEESQKYCQTKGKKVLKHLLTPRTKGFVASVKELRNSQVTHVYDVTIGYFGPKGLGHAPDLTTINGTTHLTPKYQFHIHVRKWAIKDLPERDEELTAWIEKVWTEKDEILEGLQQKWILWPGLIGWGSLTNSKSGAYGVYHQPVWKESVLRSDLELTHHNLSQNSISSSSESSK